MYDRNVDGVTPVSVVTVELVTWMIYRTVPTFPRKSGREIKKKFNWCNQNSSNGNPTLMLILIWDHKFVLVAG